ncbi:MAG: S41 family peptidase [Roseiflexaceae bacterium]
MPDIATAAQLVALLLRQLDDLYVFPETVPQIRQLIEARLHEDAYPPLADGAALAKALTNDMQEITRDKHLRLFYSEEPIPPRGESFYSDPTALAEYAEEQRQINYGFARVERLPGNIGYLDLRQFASPIFAGETAVAAMNLLAHTSALIVDLRQNGGGDPNQVALITSYLFDGEPVHLNSLYWREGDQTQQFWTLPYVPGRRYGNKPVYVLTSSRTFSGAEEFAYNLKARGRAVLIGERTGGGAHPGDRYRLAAHFEVFIPTGRAINPITGSNWEGSGVEPDIAVPQEQAYELAYGEALRRVITEAAVGPETRPARSLLKEARAALARLEAHG